MPAPATISKSISGFDPRSVPGCRLWLDAADISSTTGTSPVTAWRDKSSFGNNTTSYGGTPAISTSAINGRRTLYFNGSSYFLGAISAASSTTITVIMVASLISPFGGFSGLVCFGNPSQFDYDNVGSLPITMYNDQFKIYGARNSSSQPTPISAGVPFIYVLQYDGTYINTWKNGTIQTDPSTNVASSGTFTYTNYSVACRSGTISGQYPWSGYIGEILVYQSVLTPSQRQSIEGYLAWKWGLETISSRNLVLGHPFYYNTPFSRGFQPIDITNCALWLDAADSTTTGGGSTLTTWLDKSGRENTATSGSGTIAVSSTGLTFNGSTNYMTVAGLAGAIANTSFVIFIVETLTGSSGYYFGDDNVNAGTDSALHIGYRSQTNQTFAFYADDLEDYAISGSNIRRVWTHWLPTGANRVTRRNGAVDVTLGNSNRLLAFTAPRIGRVFGGNYYTGIISEILVYTIDIGIQNILPIEGYLSWKWGLQSSLPNTHPFYRYPPSSAIPFLPINLSGCALWLDGADLSSINLSGSNVTQWNDKSGNGRNLPAVSGFSNATISSAFQNGLSVLNFSGNGLYRTAADSTVYPQDVYVIVALKSLTTHVDVLGMGPTNVDNFNSLTFSEGIQSRWQNGSSSGVRNVFSPTNETSTGFLLIQWSLANNNYLLRRNGTQLVQSSSFTYTLPSGSVLQIGFRHTNLNQANFSGYIGEIIVFNSQLANSERQKVEGYLASKWGLTSSLPTIHPYRQFEPAQESYIPVAAYSNFLWTRFYNITSDPSINGPGSSGWGSLIGTAGAYNPINFQDSDARIGQSDYVGVISKGFMYSATTTVVTFRTNSDDGIVVFFNGVNVLQNWTYHGDTINDSASVTLPAGYTPIELRFFEWGGGFTCELYWSVGSTGTYVSDGTGVMFYNATSQS